MLKHCVVETEPNPREEHHVARLRLVPRLYLGLLREPPVGQLAVHPPRIGEQPNELRSVVPCFNTVAVTNRSHQQKN